MNFIKTKEEWIIKTPRMEVVNVEYEDEHGNPELIHTIIRSRPSVAIIVRHEGKIAFIKQFRSTTGEFYIELPAGLLEEGETEEMAAVRETEEETGIVVSNVKVIVKGPSLLDPSKSNENYGVAIADMVGKKKRHLDKTEKIDDQIIWLEENFVFKKLREQLFKGEKFYENLFLSGHSLYALMAYMISK